MKIVLYCPVREKPEVLELVLQSHRALKGISERWYFDDDFMAIENGQREESLCGSGAMLTIEHFKFGATVATPEMFNERGAYEDHKWTSKQMDRMGRIRDFGIEEFLKTDYDALLIVDADIVLPPDLALTLAETMAESHLRPRIVSEVFWSKWPNSDVWMPNVWDVQAYRFDSPESILRLRDAGAYNVGGLGAVTLISRAALEAGARYATVSGLGYIGEDRHFSVRAQSLGIELLADTCCTPFHVYWPEQLEEARVWFETGCRREYFDTWLDEKWESEVRRLYSSSTATVRKGTMLAVCTPGEHFPALWVWHYFELWCGAVAAKVGFVPFQGYCTNPYVTRQIISRDVLRCPAPIDYVLWIDDDNIVSWDAVARLIQDLEEHPEASAVAGWAWIQADFGDGSVVPSVGRWIDNTLVHLTPDELKADGLIEIDASGFPCLLMRRELIEKVGPDGFMANRDGWPRFIGEDVAFCLEARRQGLRLFADARVHVPHLKLRAIEARKSAPLMATSFEKASPNTGILEKGLHGLQV